MLQPERIPFPTARRGPSRRSTAATQATQVGFVEFDQQGQLVEPLQQDKALALITEAKKRLASKKVITLVYVHGWKNNANQARPGGKPQDVERFRGALTSAERSQAKAASPDSEPCRSSASMSAWKGKSLMGPGWFTWLSVLGPPQHGQPRRRRTPDDAC